VSDENGEIALEQRQVIFRELVEAQDAGMGVAASRAEIARRHAISEEKVKEIEREGSDRQWPPL
jgi:hypothetical protein